jgi:predicted membrane-bound spermidine synthase
MFEVDMGMFNQPMIFLSTFFCGVAGGYQFPLATRIYFSDIHKSNQNIGILYGFDITGAMLGTLVFGILCIPLFGFWKVSLIIFIINLLISIFTFLNTKYEKLNLN